MTKCDGCGEEKMFVSTRTYKLPQITSPITSKGMLCGKCYRKIKSATIPKDKTSKYISYSPYPGTGNRMVGIVYSGGSVLIGLGFALITINPKTK